MLRNLEGMFERVLLHPLSREGAPIEGNNEKERLQKRKSDW